MTATTITTTGRAGVLALALALVASLLGTVGVSAAHADVTVERIAGADRYETGGLISQYAFADPESVSVAYLATGQNFPDALAAGAAAAAKDAPVIITRGDRLPDEARDELRRLDLDEVIVVGGPNAVSDDVFDAVADDVAIGATVRRITGENRYATAANTAVDAFPGGTNRVYIAVGTNFPDALSGVPAAARYGAALLLASTDVLPTDTAEAITTLAATEVIILGGTAAISASVEADLRNLDTVTTVTRFAGTGRYDTAAQVSASAYTAARVVFLATGGSFPDALGGGPAAARFGAPLLLTAQDALPTETIEELRFLNPRLVVIIGGTSAVSQAVEDDLARVLAESTALPSGVSPDVVSSRVDNRTVAGERQGDQTIQLGTVDGEVEVLTNPDADQRDLTAFPSPDGSRLVFLRRDAGSDSFSDDLWFVDVVAGAGSSRRLLHVDEVEEGCGISDVEWAPDSQHLAITCRNRENPEDGESIADAVLIIDVRVAGHTVLRMPGTENAEPIDATFAPDATLVVEMFEPSEFDFDRFQYHAWSLTDLTTSTGRYVSTPQGQSGSAAILGPIMITGDGRFLIGYDAISVNIVVIDIDTDASRLALPDDHQPRFDLHDVTADGATAIVVMKNVDDAFMPLPDSLATIDLATGTVTEIVPGSELTHGRITRAQLNADDTRIVFDDVLGTVAIDEGIIRLIDVDGTDAETLFADDDVIHAFPRWLT